LKRIHLRPVAFVDAPFGLDEQARRLAGGLLWFSAVEVLSCEEGRGVEIELIPVERVEAELGRLGEDAAATWANLTSSRAALSLGERIVRLDQPQAVGILDCSEGGVDADVGFAMAAGGAAIIEVGGESTAPGAKPIWEGDELERVLPTVKRLAPAGVALSIASRKAAVMESTLAAGATMVADASGLTFDDQSAGVLARAGCPIVLSYAGGAGEGPIALRAYDWLEARITAAEAAGISRDKIIVDPGVGAAGSVQHNLQLVNALSLFHGLGCPIMIGASRARMIGALAGEAPEERRLGGSIALAIKAAEQGVQLLRAHDVTETVQALKVWRGLRDAALTPAG
jgi:dihydropteroate synthase